MSSRFRVAILTDVNPSHPGHSRHIAPLVALLGAEGVRPEIYGADQYLFNRGGWYGPGITDGPAGVVLNRTSTLGTWSSAVAEALEDAGWVCLDPGAVLYQAADKWTAYRRFHTAGLPTIDTSVISARPRHGDESGLDSPYGYPCVVKARHSSGGRRVWRCRNRGEYQQALAELEHPDDGALVQPYVTEPGQDRDLRVHVAGGTARFVIERRAPAGGWQTAMAAGASTHTPDPHLGAHAMRLAEQAAATTGLSWTAVDLLVGADNNLYVCEANPSPGIAATVATLGLDPLRPIIRDLLQHGQAQLP